MIKSYSQSADVLKQMKQVSEMTPAELSTEYTTWDPGQSHANILVAHGLAFIWHLVIWKYLNIEVVRKWPHIRTAF